MDTDHYRVTYTLQNSDSRNVPMLLSCTKLPSYVNGTKYTETIIFAPGALHMKLSPQSIHGKRQNFHLRDHCTFKIRLS